MPGMTEICVFLAWIAGGFVSGVSGIGGAMVAFPFLAMLLPVHEAIALTCIVNMVMDICLASLHFRFCRVSALWPMLLASVPGSFAGLYILQICSGPVLQGVVGLLLLGGEGKDPLQGVETLALGQPRGEGVAVAGLALPGKGTHQVQPGLAVGKGKGHTVSSSSRYG